MRLKDDVNLQAFLTVVDKCEDEVFLYLQDGSVINLKSMLSKFVFASIAGTPEFLENSKIVCKDQKDETKLAGFTEST